MRVIALMLAAICLAGCGADGEPVQPTAQAKVSATPSGVALGTTVGVRRGPFTVNWGVTL